ncbi:ATPase [Cutibacterium acnes JCM 18909]|nr:ATPase [Cutibacterium acnes JCM 18909]
MVRYSDLLESLFLIHRLPAWSRNLTKRQIQRPKVFLTDTGLNAALSNMDAAHLSSMQGADHLGPLLEQFVVCELLRQQGWSATPFKLFHYRDRQGAEVDIIVETPAGIIAVKVTSAVAATARHFQHLKALRDRLGDEFLAGIVLTTGTGQKKPAIGSNRFPSRHCGRDETRLGHIGLVGAARNQPEPHQDGPDPSARAPARMQGW